MVRKRGLRSQFYRDARILGNIEAAAQGPSAFGKRLVWRKVYAKTNGHTDRVAVGRDDPRRQVIGVEVHAQGVGCGERCQRPRGAQHP